VKNLCECLSFRNHLQTLILFVCRLRDLPGYKKFRDSCMLSPQDALKLQAANGEALTYCLPAA